MKSGISFIAGLAGILCLIQFTLAKTKSSVANHPIRPPYPQPQHHFPHFPYPQPLPYPPNPYPPNPYPPYPYPPHPQPRPPTYPPSKPSCDLCTEVKDGLKETLDSLQMISDQVTPMNDCPGDFRFISGDFTNTPDTPSRVSCPEDYDVIDCRCDRENDDCDGTQVIGKTCTATKATSGHPVKALAICVPSCSGPYTFVTQPNDGTFAEFPTVTCGANTELIGCWALDRTNNAFVGTDIDGNTCKIARPAGCGTGAEGCQIQAVCQAI